MDRISVVIVAYNEERSIAGCLASVAWADEIVLIDASSTDGTAAIAAQMGARVISRPNQPIAEINKNFGIEQATGDWVLVLDSDEHVPATLAARLRACAASPGDVAALRLARRNIMLGQWQRHGLRWPDYQTRFFRRGQGHLQPKMHGQTIVEGKVQALPAVLDLALLHDPVDDFGGWVQKLTRYAITEGQTMQQEGIRPSWCRILLYPPGLFLYDYIWRRAFLDGRAGFVLSALLAYYTFLKRVILWEMGMRKSGTGG